MNDEVENTPIERQDADMGITSEVLDLPEAEGREVVVESLLNGKDLYTTVLWAGRIPVYKCKVGECKANKDSEDEMILHCLQHFPEESREALLEVLLKNKQGDEK